MSTDPSVKSIRRRPPLDPNTFPPDMRQVVRWHLLMAQADAITTEHGPGLASVWSAVKRGNYDEARATLDRIAATLGAARDEVRS